MQMANFRRSGCFVAGLLVGSAAVTAAFALAVEDPGAGTAYLALGTLAILASGIAVQILSSARVTSSVTSKKRPGELPPAAAVDLPP